MLKEDQVGTILEATAAYAEGDLGPLMVLLSPEVTWISHGPPELSWCGTFQGVAGVEEYLKSLSGAIEIQSYHVEHTVHQGDWLVYRAKARARHRQTGKEQVFEKVDFMRFEDGLLVLFEEFFDTAAALQLESD